MASLFVPTVGIPTVPKPVRHQKFSVRFCVVADSFGNTLNCFLYQDLQRQLANYHDDSVVVKAMKDKLSGHPVLERENRRLKDEVAALR